MASVRLGRYELEEYDLPKVCMRCGARAVLYKERRFRWSPSWVIITILFGVLPYFLISEATTRRMTVWVPCCEEHAKRPLWPTLVSVGILLHLIVTAAILAVVFNSAGALALICGVGVLLFIIWAFASVILHTPAIRPSEITDKSITLKGVCGRFIDALEEARRAEDEAEDSTDRPPRRRPREDDEDGGYYDPGAKRRRRDGDEEDR